MAIASFYGKSSGMTTFDFTVRECEGGCGKRSNCDYWKKRFLGRTVYACRTCLARMKADYGRTRKVYRGEFQGHVYSEHTSRIGIGYASVFKCVTCANAAEVWDHCHEHGFLRGPLCRTCNTVTPKTNGEVWKRSENASKHFTECPECRKEENAAV